jgi:hypothetical protein
MIGTASKKRELSKCGKKASTYRRIVTGNVNGKSVVQGDEHMQAYQFKTVPGYEHTLIWVNPTTPDISKEQRFDSYPDSVVPGPGGTSLHFVTFPPDSVFADPSFDGEAARDLTLIRLRGLADHFEKGRSRDAQDEHGRLLGCLRWSDLAEVGRRQDSAFEPWRRGGAKRYAPRMAKQRHQAGHDALFLERRKSSRKLASLGEELR